MSTVKKIYYFSPDRFNYYESWLEDMARQGLILREQKSFICEFEVGEATECKYRVIPGKASDISPEERSLYEEAGWKYIPSKGQAIFCNKDPNATELFTDIDSWRKRTKKYRIGRILGLLALLIFWISYVIISRLSSGSQWNLGSTHTLDIDVVLVISVACCCFGLIIMLICDINGLLGFLHSTSNNKVEHNLPYTKAINQGRLAYMSLIVIVVSITVFFICGWNGGMLSLKNSLSYENPDLVRFSEFDENTWNTYYDLITGKNDESGEYCGDYFINKGKTLIRNWVHEGYHISQEIPDPDDVGNITNDTIAYYSMEYSEFRNSTTAEKFLAEDIAYDSTWDDSSAKEIKPEDISIACSDVDYAGYYSESLKLGYAGNQTLYLRKGAKLIEVYYTGDKNLLNELDLFVARLQ